MLSLPLRLVASWARRSRCGQITHAWGNNDADVFADIFAENGSSLGRRFPASHWP